ncbi:hypothetical protein NUACC21_39400 [Scytonema sp. NUACC21]
MNTEYITKTDLKITRGWTDAAIKKFLGKEDKNTRNPLYRQAAPVCLYLLTRVLEAESSQEFEQWKILSSKRREAARKGAQTRLEREEERRIEAHIRDLEIQKQQQLFREALSAVRLNIKPLPHKELVAIACDQWNKNPPEIMRSTVTARTEILEFSVIIERMDGFGKKRIPSLVNKAHGCLAKYYQRQDSGDIEELRKSINALYSLCRECRKLFSNVGSRYSILKHALQLNKLNHFNQNTNVEDLCNWLTNFVDVIQEGIEELVIEGSAKIIRIQDLINTQILKIHEVELNACQEELNTILEHFQEWVPSADVRANRRYQELIEEKYPQFSY